MRFLEGEPSPGDQAHYSDLLIASMAFVCGGILLFEGWRLDPILLLCQVLASLMVIGVIGENIVERLIWASSITKQPLSRKQFCFSWRMVWYMMKLRPRWWQYYYDQAN